MVIGVLENLFKKGATINFGCSYQDIVSSLGILCKMPAQKELVKDIFVLSMRYNMSFDEMHFCDTIFVKTLITIDKALKAKKYEEALDLALDHNDHTAVIEMLVKERKVRLSIDHYKRAVKSQSKESARVILKHLWYTTELGRIAKNGLQFLDNEGSSIFPEEVRQMVIEYVTHGDDADANMQKMFVSSQNV